MANRYELDCTHCNHPNDITLDVCPACGERVEGTINTRRASIPAEKEALKQRYQAAANEAAANGLADELQLLEKTVIEQGRAVINADFDFVWNWLGKKAADYVTYRRQIIDNLRPPAFFENDSKRSVADAALFGSESDIVYAALTVDGNGLISYGEVSAILKVLPVEKRTSALETNSYSFLREAANKGWTHDEPLPPGYMAVWHNKHQLCAAKLAKNLQRGQSGAGIGRLVLSSNGDRAQDDFVELYIYGKIIAGIVEKIRVPKTLQNTTDRRMTLKINQLNKLYPVEFY